MSVVKENVSILEEVLEILGNFIELNACELPKDLPPTRDKCHMDNVDFQPNFNNFCFIFCFLFSAH